MRTRNTTSSTLLSEVPGNSVTFWDARKIVDRLRLHAGELLEIVRLLDPVRATLVIEETNEG